MGPSTPFFIMDITIIEVPHNNVLESHYFKMRSEIRDWFDIHVGRCGHKWDWSIQSDHVKFRFVNSQSAMLFRLTWG